MDRRAFTLIELLVVMSTIAILAALLLPLTSRIRGEARKMQCVSNLGQLGKAINLYVDDNENWYPCATIMPSTEAKGGLPRICDLLACYTDPRVFECPDDRPTDPEYAFGTYFEGEGSSYEWAELLNYLKVGQPVRYAPIKIEDAAMLRDYEPFHRRGSGKLGVNCLYHDGHVESF